ncbi:hypothetical protein GGR55DRAFT_685732 [Xylaria sp. FL0064]|nr:hypothetical protein GGR55DRAFT_685732 [Xylaria sp. FL0064]
MEESNRLAELEAQLRDAENPTRRGSRERQRADESEEHRRPTSLVEYITACHELVFSQLKVETNKALTSRGPITNPRNKYCPTSLKPWPDFLQEQNTTFGGLYATFSPERRAFENRSFLAGLGRRVSLRPIKDEKTLEYSMHVGVEDPVTAIMDELKTVGEFRTAFDIGSGISFENHPNAISTHTSRETCYNIS